MKTGLVYACLSNKGRVRGENEDSWYADGDSGIFIVSDGMGGQAGGALASTIVRETMPPLIKQRLADAGDLGDPKTKETVAACISDLSGQVNLAARGNYGYSGMGATIVMALVRGGKAMIAYLGDSRAYLYRDRAMKRLTNDHSVVRLLVESGDITAEQARTHPSKGQITRFVGMDGEVEPDFAIVDLKPGDRLLLCSDGLTAMVSDEKISSILRKMANPDVICHDLVDEANLAGGRDNITVALVDWPGDGNSPVDNAVAGKPGVDK